MKNVLKTRLILIMLVFVGIVAGCAPKQVSEPTLKSAFEDFFYFGVALNAEQIDGSDSLAQRIVIDHFNSITAENIMKSEVIQPVEGQFDFTYADKFVELGQKHNMYMVGHTLIWHSQAPDWFFVDSAGNDVSREVLIERMRTHIFTLVERYKGRVQSWDVVNEAILEDGSWRPSKFYQIIGPEYFELAFKFAHEADPAARLYYNDYNLAKPAKRDGAVRLVKILQEKGIPIHGVGIQGHEHLDFPPIEEFEKSIIAFHELGVDVMVTELDITTLPRPGEVLTADVNFSLEYFPELNPYADGLPDSVAVKLHNRYHDFFRLFLKHHDKIHRVTMWGLHDGQSWLNYWPIRDRTDYPLLFDRNLQPKPIVETIINEALNTKRQ